MSIDWDLYGIGWSGPVSTDDSDNNAVTVPEFSTHLAIEALQEAMEGVDDDLSLIEKFFVAQRVLHSLL